MDVTGMPPAPLCLLPNPKRAPLPRDSFASKFGMQSILRDALRISIMCANTAFRLVAAVCCSRPCRLEWSDLGPKVAPLQSTRSTTTSRYHKRHSRSCAFFASGWASAFCPTCNGCSAMSEDPSWPGTEFNTIILERLATRFGTDSC